MHGPRTCAKEQVLGHKRGGLKIKQALLYRRNISAQDYDMDICVGQELQNRIGN
jgi:hypothetical protein